MNTIIKSNTNYTLELLITGVDGNGVEGLTINYSIYKSYNNELIESNMLKDIGNGVYAKNIAISIVGQYRVYYATPENYENYIETIIVEDSINLDTAQSPVYTSTSEPVNNLKFDNEFTLLDTDTIIYGGPVLLINYHTILLQCIMHQANTMVNIEVSNDGINWITVYTFSNHSIKNMPCYKFMRAKIISGKAEIYGVAHNNYNRF